MTSVESRTDAPSRARAIAVVALFVGALVVSLVRPVVNARDAEVASLVDAARAHAGDLPRGGRVLVHPPWRDDVVRAVKDARVFAEGTVVTTAISVKHGDPPPPLLVVADGHHPLPTSLLRATRAKSERDGVVVRVTHDDAMGPLDLSRRLFEARVHVEKSDGSVVTCRYQPSNDAHTCAPLPSWNRVARETVKSGKESRACIWAHPVSKGHVVITFPGVVARGPLAFTHAFADSALQSKNDSPVTTTVQIDGREALRAARDKREGFLRRTVPFPADGEPHDVVVRVTTDDDGARHYCFTLDDGSAP